MARRRESPTRRKNPSGKIVWVARWTDKAGKRRSGLPPEIPGTYAKKGPCREGGTACCAQHAIDAAYEADERGPVQPETVGGYFDGWLKAHPRSKVTNRTNTYRVEAVLDVELDGVKLRDWRFDQLRRRHALLLVDHMLTVQGRAKTGAVNVLGVLSAMTEDAIGDDCARVNPFRGVRVRGNDPRVQKPSRPVRVWSWDQMHEFAAACGRAEKPGGVAWREVYAEPMVRVLSDCGVRIGEVFPLYMADLNQRDGTLELRWTVGLGDVLPGTKTDHAEAMAGRVVPVPGPLVDMLAGIVASRPAPLLQPHERDRAKFLRPDALMFPSPRGKLWGYQNWWRYVWEPGREVSGLDMRPHEARHSWVSWLRAAGVDPADLADAAGHTELTATARYSHGVGRSFDAMREAVGS